MVFCPTTELARAFEAPPLLHDFLIRPPFEKTSCYDVFRMDGDQNFNADPTSRFFTNLARREHEPLLRRSIGNVRFDLLQDQATKHWMVVIQKGHVSVTRRNTRADTVVRLEKRLFDALASGEANAMAAFLRGEVEVEGDYHLLTQVQRLFPGPQEAPGS